MMANSRVIERLDCLTSSDYSSSDDSSCGSWRSDKSDVNKNQDGLGGSSKNTKFAQQAQKMENLHIESDDLVSGVNAAADLLSNCPENCEKALNAALSFVVETNVPMLNMMRDLNQNHVSRILSTYKKRFASIEEQAVLLTGVLDLLSCCSQPGFLLGTYEHSTVRLKQQLSKLSGDIFNLLHSCEANKMSINQLQSMQALLKFSISILPSEHRFGFEYVQGYLKTKIAGYKLDGRALHQYSMFDFDMEDDLQKNVKYKERNSSYPYALDTAHVQKKTKCMKKSESSHHKVLEKKVERKSSSITPAASNSVYFSFMKSIKDLPSDEEDFKNSSFDGKKSILTSQENKQSFKEKWESLTINSHTTDDSSSRISSSCSGEYDSELLPFGFRRRPLTPPKCGKPPSPYKSKKNSWNTKAYESPVKIQPKINISSFSPDNKRSHHSKFESCGHGKLSKRESVFGTQTHGKIQKHSGFSPIGTGTSKKKTSTVLDWLIRSPANSTVKNSQTK